MIALLEVCAMSQLTYSIPSARLFRTCLRTHHQLTIPNALTTCYTSQLNSTEHIESEIICILAVKSRRFEELKSDEDVQEAALASERYALLNSVKVSCHMPTAGMSGTSQRISASIDVN